ncbi:hypothetical protein QF006_000030 [Pantoea agglomerans]|jgi:hypothetical protein|nr:hypothetical protein [Pantoea agglomerans]
MSFVMIFLNTEHDFLILDNSVCLRHIALHLLISAKSPVEVRCSEGHLCLKCL